MSLAISNPQTAAPDPLPKRWTSAEFQQLLDFEFFGDKLVHLVRGVIRQRDARLRQDNPWKWTRKEYYRLWEMGLIPNRRVQLIDGEIFLMHPQNPPHASAIGRVSKVLEKLFGKTYHARIQLPLPLGLHSDPEPDIAMVPGHPDDYDRCHPTSAPLIVEVSDSTLIFDRATKGRLYAQGGIADYWIVNLLDGCLEVYREPSRKGYKSPTILEPSEVVSPLHLPKARLKVAALFPYSG
jgi:Uma2 family endonuclease